MKDNQVKPGTHQDGGGPYKSEDLETLNKVEDPSTQIQRVTTESLVSFGIAICVHSLIDGLAIGIYEEVGTIAVLAVSVVIHKIPVAISVG